MLKKLIIVFIVPAFIFAAVNSGTTAGSFLKINTGSRSSALGGAFCGLADDNEALNINPAGIAQLTVPEFSGGHIIWFSDIAVEHFQFTIPLSETLVLGLSGIYMNNGSFEAFTASAVSAGTFTAYDAAAGLTLGVKLSDKIFLGVTAKYITVNIAADSAAGYAGDGGILVKNILPGISFGAALQNIGTDLKLWTTAERLPQALRAGFAFSPSQNTAITFDGITHLTEGDFNLGAGFELEFIPKTAAFRAGYYFPLSSRIIDYTTGISAGMGFNIAPVTINYAIIPGGDLGYVHRISAAYAFGAKKKPLPDSSLENTGIEVAVLMPFVSKNMDDSEQKSMFEIIKNNLLSSRSVRVIFDGTGGLLIPLTSAAVISGTMEKTEGLIEITASLKDPSTGKELAGFSSKAGSFLDAHKKANELSKELEKYLTEHLKVK